MAVFEIQRNGKTYEIDAPDHVAALRSLDALSGASKGPSPAAVADVDKLEKLGIQSGMGHQVADNASLGAFNPVMGAVGATLKTAGKALTGRETNWTADYQHERDVLDEQLRRARERSWGPKVPIPYLGGELDLAELGLSLPFAPMKAVQAGGEAVAAAPGLIRQGIDAAKAGGIYSGIYGFNSARGGVGEHLEGAATNALGGAVLGPGMHYGLQGAINTPRVATNAFRRVTGRSPEAVEAVRNNLAESSAAGVREFAPIATDNPLLGTMSRMLANRQFVGEPIRRQAQGAIDDVTGQARQVVSRMTGDRPANDIGADVQQTLRRNLVERSIPRSEIEAMPSDALPAITGAAPRPVAEPVQPRGIRPVEPEPINPESLQHKRFDPDPVEAPPMGVAEKLPTVEQMPVPEHMTAADRRNWAGYQATTERLKRLQAGEVPPPSTTGVPGRNWSPEAKVDLYKKVFHPDEHPGRTAIDAYEAAKAELALRTARASEARFPTPDAIRSPNMPAPGPGAELQAREAQAALMKAQAQFRSALAKAEAEADKVFRGNPDAWSGAYENFARSADALRSGREAISKHQEELWNRDVRGRHENAARDAQQAYEARVAEAQRRADEQTAVARAETVAKAEAEARQRAEAATEQLRAQAQRDAAEATRKRQAELDARYEGDKGRLATFEPGRSRETYPTEFDAAYERVNRETPTFQRHVLGERGDSAKGVEPTATARLLEDFALEARRRYELPGYKEGRLFGPEGKSPIDPALEKPLSELLGADIAQKLLFISVQRANGKFAPGPQGVRDLATEVRRARQAAEKPPFPGEPRPERAAALRRLEGALKEDYHRFVTETGPAGKRLSEDISNVDAKYAEHIETMRKPLGKLFGPKTEPLDALDQLVAAAREGNLSVIRPYMRVMTEKADPTKGAAAIVSHITQGAPDLTTFLKGYRSIKPEVKQVLFASESGMALRTQLDRLAVLGTKLEPYAAAIEKNATGGIRAGHVPIAASLWFHFIPTMTAYAGGALTARFMASPRYVAWLTKAIQAKTPAQIENSVANFSFIAARDKENAPALKRAVRALGSAVISPAGASFLGEDTAGADKEALAQAKKMQADGRSRDDIWRDTGWFQGRDGSWSYEVDDSGARLNDTVVASIKSTGRYKGKLGDAMQHDDLFKADPSARDVAVDWKVNTSPLYGAAHIEKVPPEIRMHKDPADLGLSTLLHERQHVGDHMAGVNMGAENIKPFYGTPRIQRLQDRLGERIAERNTEKDRGNRKRLDQEIRSLEDDIKALAAYEGYLRRHGEDRARRVESRREMSRDERRQVPPWMTGDVPWNEVEAPPPAALARAR